MVFMTAMLVELAILGWKTSVPVMLVVIVVGDRSDHLTEYAYCQCYFCGYYPTAWYQTWQDGDLYYCFDHHPARQEVNVQLARRQLNALDKYLRKGQGGLHVMND